MNQINHWDKIAESPEAASVYMSTYGEGVGAKTRHELGAFIEDGDMVLDVGCGPGWNYEHFKEHGPKVGGYRGLDYSKVMIEGCRLKYPDASFSVGDVRHVSEAPESWDVVIMQDVLEHTNGYEKPVKEALRVARRRAIFTFWHMAEDNEHINDDGDDGWGAWYERGKWEKFLDSLDLHWLHHQFEFPEGRVRDFYIVDKETKHGL